MEDRVLLATWDEGYALYRRIVPGDHGEVHRRFEIDREGHYVWRMNLLSNGMMFRSEFGEEGHDRAPLPTRRDLQVLLSALVEVLQVDVSRKTNERAPFQLGFFPIQMKESALREWMQSFEDMADTIQRVLDVNPDSAPDARFDAYVSTFDTPLWKTRKKYIHEVARRMEQVTIGTLGEVRRIESHMALSRFPNTEGTNGVPLEYTMQSMQEGNRSYILVLGMNFVPEPSWSIKVYVPASGRMSYHMPDFKVPPLVLSERAPSPVHALIEAGLLVDSKPTTDHPWTERMLEGLEPPRLVFEEALEPYRLLGAGNPLMWELKDFKTWVKAQS